MSTVQEDNESFSKEPLEESLVWPLPVVKTEIKEEVSEYTGIEQVWLKKEYELLIKEDIANEQDPLAVNTDQGNEDETFAFHFKSEELIIDDVQMEGDSSKTSNSTNNSLVFSCEKSDVNYSSPLHLENLKKFCRGPKISSVNVKPEEVITDIYSLVKVVNDKDVFCCKWCNYQTKYSRDMKRHLVTHTGAKSYRCEVCNKTFTRTDNLTKHKLIHSQDKPYKCGECGYVCNQASHLKTHMTRHTGEKVFACTLCEYKTADSSHLRRHTRSHTQEKPFSCKYCEYKATVSSTLQRHIRAKHTGEKPYSCTHCDYKSTQRNNLQRHILRMHTEETPFSCSYGEYNI